VHSTQQTKMTLVLVLLTMTMMMSVATHVQVPPLLQAWGPALPRCAPIAVRLVSAVLTAYSVLQEAMSAMMRCC
jgi:hypothetical protein